MVGWLRRRHRTAPQVQRRQPSDDDGLLASSYWQGMDRLHDGDRVPAPGQRSFRDILAEPTTQLDIVTRGERARRDATNRSGRRDA